MDAIPLIDPPLQSLRLKDGRQLTWQEFGAPQGRPALYFHGGGSLSLEAGIYHREAVQRNIRLIATNRPGVSGSDRVRGRSAAGYADDLVELLGHLRVQRFACFGESNGGLMTMAIAATLASRVVGAVPINPTVPWFDPVARSVTSGLAAWGYRLMRHWPRLLVRAAAGSGPRLRRQRAAAGPSAAGFSSLDLAGPPPGTEADIAEIHWRFMDSHNPQALLDELDFATRPWGFDHYAIPVALDFYCGVYDSQAPFALVLADRNPNARFHYFAYGHHGFSHPDARRRIVDTIAGYFDAQA
ncbi:MAG TPA: alpha/beta hydrolase [Fontimonas sp.]